MLIPVGFLQPILLLLSGCVAWRSLCFHPPEGAQSFGAGGLPLPGHHAGSTPSNRLLSSKAHDGSALVLHQDHWYISTLHNTPVRLSTCPPVQPFTCPAVHLSSWASIKTKPISSHSPGSKGAFCELRQGDRRMLDFYTKLGYFNSVSVTEDIVVMGTSLQQWSVSRGSSGHSVCVLWSHRSSPSWWELKECFRNGCIILNCC